MSLVCNLTNKVPFILISTQAFFSLSLSFSLPFVLRESFMIQSHVLGCPLVNLLEILDLTYKDAHHGPQPYISCLTVHHWAVHHPLHHLRLPFIISLLIWGLTLHMSSLLTLTTYNLFLLATCQSWQHSNMDFLLI